MASRVRSRAQRLTSSLGLRPRTRLARALLVAGLALGLAACGSGGGGQPGSSAAGSTPVSATSREVTVSLSVALQPPHLAETVQLKLGGAEVAKWTSDSKNPAGVLTLNGILEGERPYEMQGSYSFYNSKGLLEQKPVHGSGTVTVAANGYYAVTYDSSTDSYAIQRLR